MLDPMADRFADLTRSLGDARDLALLHDELRADPDAFGGKVVTTEACRFTQELRVDLERRGLSLASRLYAEQPQQLAARVGAYWTARQETGDEEPAGRVEVTLGSASIAGMTSSEATADELDELSVAQLRLLARNSDLPGRSRAQRFDLIAMLRASRVTGRGVVTRP